MDGAMEKEKFHNAQSTRATPQYVVFSVMTTLLLGLLSAVYFLWKEMQ